MGAMRKRMLLPIAVVAALAAKGNGYAGEHALDARVEFDRRASELCPAKGLDSRPFGDIDFWQEGFASTLSASDSRMLDQAIPRIDGGPAACADRDGLGCPTAWTMLAIRKSGLLPQFVRYACANAATIPGE